MKVKIFLFFIFSISYIACKKNSVNNLFETFIQRESNDNYLVFQTADLTPIELLDNNYRRIIENRDNTNYLLEKAESIKETKYCLPNLVCPMAEGDIAICMLIDMYQMPDDYFDTVMYVNIKRKTNTAADFWDYIHTSENNRKEIIRKITDWIMIYKSGNVLFPRT